MLRSSLGADRKTMLACRPSSSLATRGARLTHPPHTHLQRRERALAAAADGHALVLDVSARGVRVVQHGAHLPVPASNQQRDAKGAALRRCVARLVSNAAVKLHARQKSAQVGRKARTQWARERG